MKVKVFHANGTAYLVNSLALGFNISNFGHVHSGLGGADLTPQSASFGTIAGLDGQTQVWDYQPQNDPFPALLDPDLFDVERIIYPASLIGIGPSVTFGRGRMRAGIQQLTKGTPILTVGYSQGAAVCSGIELDFRPGGVLEDWASGYIGSVRFGNPRRQLNFRGEIGGTWSGAWDDPGSTTGGHGSFPATGPYARLTGCDPTTTIEFAAPNDVFTSVGDTTTGVRWTQGNDLLLNLLESQYAGAFLNNLAAAALGFDTPLLTAIETAFALGSVVMTFIDAVGKEIHIGGNGHVTYPALPPVNDDGTYPTTGDTSYQLALKWMKAKALEWATAPIALPANAYGWSTTLNPPEL